MPVLVAGRLVQGLGGGAITVALYVMVARVYPAALHPKIFAAFSAAWVIPSLVGPFAAGVVAQRPELALGVPGRGGPGGPGALMLVPALRGLHGGSERRLRRCRGRRRPEPALPPWDYGRLGWAALAALAVLGLNLSARSRGGRALWRQPPSWSRSWPSARSCRAEPCVPAAGCRA